MGGRESVDVYSAMILTLSLEIHAHKGNRHIDRASMHMRIQNKCLGRDYVIETKLSHYLIWVFVIKQ